MAQGRCFEEYKRLIELAKAASGLICFIGQKLARHDDLYAVPFGVRLTADVEREINRAHDAVAELLMDQFLDCRPIDGDDLIPAVDLKGRLAPRLGATLCRARSAARRLPPR